MDSKEAPAAKPQARKPKEGHRFVRVLKIDGTVGVMERKIMPEDKDLPPYDPKGPPQFKIIVARQKDNSLKKVMRPIKEGEDLAVASPAPKAEEAAKTEAATESPATEAKKPEAAKPAVAAAAAATASTAVSKDDKSADASSSPVAAAAPKTEKKDSEAAGAPSSRDVETNAVTTSDLNREDDAAMKDALAAQVQFNRERKMHRFKRTMLMGIAGALTGGAISHIVDIEDGDVDVSDSDMSDDDDYDSDHDHHEGDHDDHDHDHDDDHDDHIDGDDDHLLNDKAAGDFHGMSIDVGAVAATGAAAVLTAQAQQAPRQPPPAAQPGARAVPNGTKDETAPKDKVTYKVTAKEIDELNEKARENVRPLKRHWANATFYILASLSIVLPLLFLALAISIFFMKNRSVEGHWAAMDNIIKVGVSAWPIVFAAVVAQVFKTWATYRVERGIKISQLEQLVGSQSFASAVKQPLLLRRLDLLSLVVFLTWCLSPIGSQALQRATSTAPGFTTGMTTSRFLITTGPNKIFSNSGTVNGIPRPISNSSNSNLIADEMMQKIASLYATVFNPRPVITSLNQDRYNHPLVPLLPEDAGVDDDAPVMAAAYGIPLNPPKSVFDGMKDRKQSLDAGTGTADNVGLIELLDFNMTASYFRFTCDNWMVINASQIDHLWSNASTASYSFGHVGNASFLNDVPMQNQFRFASHIIRSADYLLNGTNDQTLDEYAAINCTFKQVNVDYGMGCVRQSADQIVPDCGWDYEPVRENKTYVGDGAYLDAWSPHTFAQYTSAGSATNDGYQGGRTLNEIFLAYYPNHTTYNGSAASGFDMRDHATPAVFAKRLAYLFNSYLSIGNAIDYIAEGGQHETAESLDFQTVPAVHEYTGSDVYTVDWRWATAFLVCVVLLLLAGCFSVAVESITVAPDVLGYSSSLVRNSKYLQLPKHKLNSGMSGGERLRALKGTEVMMQDVKANADVGRIALGLKHDKAEPLKKGRLYR